jgi:hypothetical protein
VFFHEEKKVFMGSPDSAGLINLEMSCGFLPWVVLDFPREVNVSGRKEIIIHVIVKGLITAHNNIPVVGTDMMNGLTVTEERADDSIKT